MINFQPDGQDVDLKSIVKNAHGQTEYDLFTMSENEWDNNYNDYQDESYTWDDVAFGYAMVNNGSNRYHDNDYYFSNSYNNAKKVTDFCHELCDRYDLSGDAEGEWVYNPAIGGKEWDSHADDCDGQPNLC